MPIATDLVSSNLDQDEVYNIVFVSSFLQVLRFPPPKKEKTDRHDIAEIVFNVALNIIYRTMIHIE